MQPWTTSCVTEQQLDGVQLSQQLAPILQDTPLVCVVSLQQPGSVYPMLASCSATQVPGSPAVYILAMDLSWGMHIVTLWPAYCTVLCTGNICRSPTAEAAFRSVVDRAGLSEQFNIDSCGTGGADWRGACDLTHQL